VIAPPVMVSLAILCSQKDQSTPYDASNEGTSVREHQKERDSNKQQR
jgi:hypothetical protein